MIKKIVVLLTALTILFSIAACDLSGKHKIYEEGYFQYIVVGENSRFPQKGEDGVVAIVGFTESGKEQEIIDIPEDIDGKPVRRIGYSQRTNTFSGGGGYVLESQNLKKIYINDNIVTVCKEAFYSWMNNDASLDIMICAAKNPYLIFEEHNFGKFYIYESLFSIGKYNENVYIANIIFMNNYSDEVNGGYYRLDNIESGEKIPPPPIPNRVGYDFMGWYLEPECINAWDFETVPTIAEDTEFRLYANWRAI